MNTHFKFLISAILLLTLYSAETSANKIYDLKDDPLICGPIMDNNFKLLQQNLRKFYGTTLNKSYFEVECMDADLIDLVIKSPRERYFTYLHMQIYFEKKQKIPEMFSQILLHEVDGRNVLTRMAKQLHLIRKTSLAGTEYEEKLLKLISKSVSYLKKHPIVGSDKAIAEHMKRFNQL